MRQQSSPTFEADNNTLTEKPKVVLREITDTPEKASEKPKEIKGKPELSAADKLNMLLNGDL